MRDTGFWQRLWLTRLSKPAGERPLYRHLLGARPARILEMGLGTLVRAERMLKTAGPGVSYVGVDRFEARGPTDAPGVTLKQAHRRLHALGRVQLVPGDADAALARLCNHLGTFDLVLVSADIEESTLARCWFFLQRVTGGDTLLFRERGAIDGGSSGGSRRRCGSSWEIVSKRQVDERAARTVRPALRRAG